MSMVFYTKGDEVYYPRWNIKSGKKLVVKDRKIYRYRSGKFYTRYLFENLLDTLVEEMHENVANDLDNVICIWGHEGTGKSNLAYWVAKKYDPNFDMKRSYTLSFRELLDKIHEYDNADEGTVFWLDEATNISNNRDWMQSDNKAFVTMLEMFRSRKWCLILCIPDYHRLDVYLREQRIRYSLHAEVLEWETQTEKRRGYFELTRMDYRTSSGYRNNIVVGYGEFSRIPAEDAQKYLQIKEETQNSKLNELHDEQHKKTRISELGKMNRKLILRLYEEDHMSYDQIAEITGLNKKTLGAYLTQARKERDGD